MIKSKIFCDMDGVLVNLVGGISKSLKNKFDEELITEIISMDFSWRKEHPDPKLNKVLDEIKVTLDNNSTFWGDTLEPLPDALELWDFISEYNPRILSHPWDTASVEGKEFWVMNNLEPRPDKIYLPLDGQKHLWATNTDGSPNILIDDFSKYIDKWHVHGGIAITHTSTKNTIRQLKEILSQR